MFPTDYSILPTESSRKWTFFHPAQWILNIFAFIFCDVFHRVLSSNALCALHTRLYHVALFILFPFNFSPNSHNLCTRRVFLNRNACDSINPDLIPAKPLFSYTYDYFSIPQDQIKTRNEINKICEGNLSRCVLIRCKSRKSQFRMKIENSILPF